MHVSFTLVCKPLIKKSYDGTEGGWDVQTHEGRDTCALDLKDVAGESDVSTENAEIQAWIGHTRRQRECKACRRTGR